MEVINVGRSSSNDEVIEDSTVSRTHCQFVKDDRGNICVIDTNSKNGVYVNGRKIYGKEYLSSSDVVRIGNTTLPWKNYFTHIIIDDPDPDPIIVEVPQEGDKTGLGTIALLISIIATVLSIISFVKFAQWGVFSVFTNAPILFWLSIGMHVIAIVIASVADYENYKDTDTADIADWISGFCLGAIGLLFIISLFQK